MSSISPSSSASNEASPLSVSCFDVVACFARIEAMAEKGILSAAEAANLAKQVFPAYHAGLRRASGSEQGSVVSDGVSSGVASRKSGFAGSKSSLSRFSRISRMKTWRASPVAPVSSGYCYTQALSDVSRDVVQERLGSYPSVYSVMGLDISHFRPMAELEALKLSGDSKVAHLSHQGDKSFLSEMAAIAANSVPALDSASTLWHSLREMDITSKAKFTGSTQIGSAEVRVHGTVVPVCVRDFRVDFSGAVPPLTSLVVVASEQSRQRFLTSLSRYASRYDVRTVDEINGLQLSDVWFLKYQRDAVGPRQWAILLGAGVRKLVCSVPSGDVVGQQLVDLCTLSSGSSLFSGLTSIGAKSRVLISGLTPVGVGLVMREFSRSCPVFSQSSVFLTDPQPGDARKVWDLPVEWSLHAPLWPMVVPARAGLIRYGGREIESQDVYRTVSDLALSCNVGCVATDLPIEGAWEFVGPSDRLSAFQEESQWPCFDFHESYCIMEVEVKVGA